MQPPEQQDSDFVRDFSKHLNLVLVAMFAASTPAQIWSRIPGSTGGWFFGFFYVGGFAMQLLYIEIKTAAIGRYDAMPFTATFGLSLFWFGLHGVRRTYLRSKGRHLHSYDPGQGILGPVYPHLPNWLSALISDLTVAVAFGIFFHLADSPVQHDWFVWVVVPSLVISQSWVKSREAFMHQRHVDAAAGAKYYADTIKRR